MLTALSERLGHCLNTHQQVLATAESCTGGGVAMAVTEVAGSSAWFDRAFVTYSNDAKQSMLGVSSQTLAKFGAVSEPVVMEMVQGALANAKATVAVSISGIAGPDGGSAEKPVGTVCFGFATAAGWQQAETVHFTGDRQQVRQSAIQYAFEKLIAHFESRR